MLRDGWSGLYIPRCFGRGVVPPSFEGMLTQRHRWCFGGMQIMRLHWRSLMPWDRSPDNHLTAAQRRDYLMASVGWFRDVLMLAFSLLLLVITGLLATGSGFAVSPMDGARSLLPLSLIIIVTISMLWTLRIWTTMSFRRALLSLVISLSVTWVVALGCLEGIARRDAVFLRTSKVGRPSQHPQSATADPGGDDPGHRPVYLRRTAGCLAAPAVAAHRHHLPPGHGLPMRPDRVGMEPMGRRSPGPGVPAPLRRTTPARAAPPVGLVPVAQAAAAGAVLVALCAGGVTSAFLAPVPLLQATAVVRRDVSPESLLAASASTQVYLKLDSPASGAGHAYYFITSVRLSTSPTGVRLRFGTASLVLLGEVLRAAAAGGRISHVSLAFRTPGLNGRPTTEFVDTFGAAAVTSFREYLSGTPSGTVSLALPAVSHVISTPGPLQRVGPFAGLPGSATALAAKVHLKMGQPERPTPSRPSNFPRRLRAPPSTSASPRRRCRCSTGYSETRVLPSVSRRSRSPSAPGQAAVYPSRR